MKLKHIALAIGASAVLAASPAHAQTEILWWHSMSGALGEWINDHRERTQLHMCNAVRP